MPNFLNFKNLTFGTLREASFQLSKNIATLEPCIKALAPISKYLRFLAFQILKSGPHIGTKCLNFF